MQVIVMPQLVVGANRRGYKTGCVEADPGPEGSSVDAVQHAGGTSVRQLELPPQLPRDGKVKSTNVGTLRSLQKPAWGSRAGETETQIPEEWGRRKWAEVSIKMGTSATQHMKGILKKLI